MCITSLDELNTTRGKCETTPERRYIMQYKMRLRVAIGITWGVAIGLVILNLYEIQRTCQATDQQSSDQHAMPIEHVVRDSPCPPCALNALSDILPPQQMQPPSVETTVEAEEQQDDDEEEEEEEEVKEEEVEEEVVAEEEYKIPNIVHYVWYATTSKHFEFHQMLSVFSAFKMLQPDSIYFHTNMQPYGKYWDRVMNLPSLSIVHRNPPRELYGEKIKDPVFYTSHSNVDRLKILTEYGGIYLDLDVLVTKSFDDLRQHDCVVGLELPDRICNSIILCNKESPYLMMWLNSFLDDYQVEEWSYNSGKVPYRLAKRYPNLVHVEADTMNRPNFKELHKIWGSVIYDWRNNYAIHLWFRVWKTMSPFYKGEDPDDTNIMVTENTFSRIARFILHSDSAIFGGQISESVSKPTTNPLVNAMVQDVREEAGVEEVIQPRHGESEDFSEDEGVDTIDRQPEVVDDEDEDKEDVGEKDEKHEEMEATMENNKLDREAYLKKIRVENQQRIQLKRDAEETLRLVTQQPNPHLPREKQVPEHEQYAQVPEVKNQLSNEQVRPELQLPKQQQQQAQQKRPQLTEQLYQPQDVKQPSNEQVNAKQQLSEQHRGGNIPLSEQHAILSQVDAQLSREKDKHEMQLQQQVLRDTMKLERQLEQHRVASVQLQPQAADSFQPKQNQSLPQQTKYPQQQRPIQAAGPAQIMQQLQQEQQRQQQIIMDNNSFLKDRLDNIKHTTVQHPHPFGSDFKLWPRKVPALDNPGSRIHLPIRPQKINADPQNIDITTSQPVNDFEMDKPVAYVPLKPDNNPFKDAFIPKKIYVQPEGPNPGVKSVEAIPDKAWLLDDGPQFQGVVHRIQLDKSRQEHLLNQLYENSKALDSPGGFQPLSLDIIPPVAVAAQDTDNIDHTPVLGLNLQEVKDPLAALDLQEEFPDDDPLEVDGEEGVDTIEEQMKREAIGGMDTGREEG
ncbi:hypothetical protein CAPTEDRAFT_197966 [Capitella teleta]|uniref:Tyrosinase copper-binding domain-containing protein n=1 Tax=Capitella teleta TaxID=283909 RepID=R7UGP0_CAPTE|nr:hypothetical protein CAPTEDRAFT_197966 [Capitella teleta]|eukprot:ELU02943.1 hypothetical protein CAPTEDRAFT_197966 [Capitella teleta]